MNRRSFFGLLAAPLVADAVPALKPGDVFTLAGVNVVNPPRYEPQTWPENGGGVFAVMPSRITRMCVVDNRLFVMCGEDLYEVDGASELLRK